MRYKLTLSYDGSAFCGWQLQPDAPSVQGALESALFTLLKSKTPVTGAGRTDTGVNARGYIAHFDSETPIDCATLRYKLNAILPDAVSIQYVEPVADDFHARFDARRREYTYYLHRCKDPFAEKFSLRYEYPELDIDAMNSAARHLLGTHDFSCFEKSGADNKTSICTVFEAFWEEYLPVCASSDEPGRYLCFHIAADRFLRNMVRAIVGTLLEVGRGKRKEEGFASLILEASEAGLTSRRSLAGESVPGHALFLTKVEY